MSTVDHVYWSHGAVIAEVKRSVTPWFLRPVIIRVEWTKVIVNLRTMASRNRWWDLKVCYPVHQFFYHCCYCHVLQWIATGHLVNLSIYVSKCVYPLKSGSGPTTWIWIWSNLAFGEGKTPVDNMVYLWIFSFWHYIYSPSHFRESIFIWPYKLICNKLYCFSNTWVR